MRLDQAKELLLNYGYDINETTTIKGSVKERGLVILGQSKTISPVIYEQTVEQLDELGVLELARTNTKLDTELDFDIIFTEDYVRANVMSGVRHLTDDETAIKWTVYDDLEEYLYLDLNISNTMATTVITKTLYDKLANFIDIDELREVARDNVRKEVEINNIADMLRLYVDEDETLEFDFMYVATVKSRIRGASVMLLDDVLQDFCRQRGLGSVTIIPSSTDEIILLTQTEPIGEINNMITQVNTTCVDAWHWLSDHAYIYTC